MSKQDIYDINMKKVGDIELSKAVFCAEVKPHLIYDAVKTQLANKRAGTSSTKTRAEVKASGVKPYRQKGTGRARHGSWVSPLFVGGGVTFGPKPRDFSLKMNKKVKKAALRSALSSKVAENRFLVIDKWAEKKKTKEMAEVFKKMKIENALIVLDGPVEWLERTVNNIPRINVAYTWMLTPYVIIAHDYIICEKDVVAKIEEGCGK